MAFNDDETREVESIFYRLFRAEIHDLREDFSKKIDELKETFRDRPICSSHEKVVTKMAEIQTRLGIALVVIVGIPAFALTVLKILDYLK